MSTADVNRVNRSDYAYVELSISGDWWLSTKRELKIRGILHGSSSTAFHLDLENSLESWGRDPQTHVIQGEQANGGKITLFRCWLQKSNGQNSTYFVHWVAVGEHFNSVSELRFNSYRFGIHLLEEWHGVRSFRAKHYKARNKVAVEYLRPSRTRIASLGSARVYLEYDRAPIVSKTIQNEMCIEHGARLRITESSRLIPFADESADKTAPDFLDMMGDICSAFSLAASASTFTYEVKATSNRLTRSLPSGKKQKVPVDLFFLARLPQEPKNPGWHNFAFCFRDLRRKPENYFNLWLASSPRIRRPVALYIQALTAECGYLEDHFASMIQALEGYHHGTEATGGKTSRKQRWTLKRRLEDLCSRHKDAMIWFTGSEKQLDDTLGKAVKFRNFLAHCLPNDPRRELKSDSPEVYEMFLALRALMQLCFLTEFGFEPRVAAKLLTNSSLFQQYARSAPTLK